MDPLSLTVSITALITLTLNVTKTLSEYTNSMKHAPAESYELAVELSAFGHALKVLGRFLAGQSTKVNSFSSTSVLYSVMHTCHGKLCSLQSILQELMKTSEGKKWYRSVVWPFKKQEHVETISALHRCMQIFQLSLSVDGCDLLSKTSEEVSTIRQTQLGTSKEVTEILSLAEKIELAVQDLGQLYLGIHDEVTELHKGQLDDERQKLLDWISSAVEPSTNHNNAVQKREPETGVWFLESDNFRNWMRSRGFLWLHGIPGCGKTVLCSTIIEAVKDVCFANTTTHKLAYFYFDFQDTKKQDVVILLRSLIRQLCAGETKLPEEAHKLHDRYKPTGHTPTVEELTSTLFAVIRYLKKEIYIIMDALDEYPEENSKRQELLVQIERMVEQRPENLHILATSRNETDIRATLGDLAGGGIPIQSSKVDADIKMYIKTCLGKDPFKKRRSNVKESIETKLAEGAHGMFRWVVCQFDILRNCKSGNDVKKAVADLPKTLDETYARILNVISEDDRGRARSILQWLAFSARPLTLQEVAEAAVLRPGDDPIDPDDRLDDAEDVLRICHSLVSLSKEEVEICDEKRECDVVRFAHFSVQEYLMSHRSDSFFISEKAAHNYIGESCISYLLSMDQPDLSERCLDDNPLFQYSAENWFTHVEKFDSYGDPASNLPDRTHKFFSQNSARSFVNWLRVYDPGDIYPEHKFELPTSEFPPPLYYASLLGLQDTVQRLLKTSVDVNEQVGHYGSAISRASENGHYQIIQRLLNHGADPNIGVESYSNNALWAASINGHYRIVRLLLDNGAEINAQDKRNKVGTALLAAAVGGHDQIVRLLLERGADVNTLCIGLHASALQAALAGGHIEIAQMLLAQGADVKIEGGFYGTALAIASGKGDEEIVQQLLKKGAEVNAEGSSKYGDALQQASAEGHDRIVQLLLEAGAEVNAPGCRKWCNALQSASKHGYYEIFERLLEAGADVNAQGGWEGSALQAASKNGHYSIVQQLLKRGVDVNAHGHGEYDPGSALQAASKRGHEQIVKLLLKHGADVNAEGGGGKMRDNSHGTPLQAASSGGHHQIVQLLLDSGADVNVPGRDYGTALQAASNRGHDQIVQLLLKHGADVNAQGDKEHAKHSPSQEEGHFKKFGNALQAASAEGWDKTVQLLLDAGADANAQNEDYGTALQAASRKGHDQIVQLLLDSGADVNAQYKGRIAMHIAEKNEHDNIVQLLLKHGASKS